MEGLKSTGCARSQNVLLKPQFSPVLVMTTWTWLWGLSVNIPMTKFEKRIWAWSPWLRQPHLTSHLHQPHLTSHLRQHHLTSELRSYLRLRQPPRLLWGHPHSRSGGSAWPKRLILPQGAVPKPPQPAGVVGSGWSPGAGGERRPEQRRRMKTRGEMSSNYWYQNLILYIKLFINKIFLSTAVITLSGFQQLFKLIEMT